METPELPDQPSPFADEADWRMSLPIEVRGIAEQYGRAIFATAWNIGAIQEATGVLMRRVRGNAELANAVTVLVSNTNSMAMALIEAYKIDPRVITTIQLDIQRAFALAGVMNRPGGKIILPN